MHLLSNTGKGKCSPILEVECRAQSYS